MSDMPEISVDPKSPGNGNLIYILYLVAIIGIPTSIVGVIMAYIGKDGANELMTNHYNNQINIFWKSMLYFVVGAVLTMVLIGFLIILAAAVWYIIRCVQGMQTLGRGEMVANPGSWLL